MSVYTKGGLIVTSGGGCSTDSLPFVPLQFFNMDTITPNQTINITGGYAGSAQLSTTVSLPYGAYTQTSVKRSGHSQSMQISIQAGETGDVPPGPGVPGFGIFPPATFGQYYGTEGQWFNMGMWMFFPTGFQCTTNLQENILKMFLNCFPAVTTGKSDIHMSPTGYALINEYDSTGNNYPSQRPGTNTNWPFNTWVWIERGTFLTTTGDNAIIRLWLNNTLVLEQNGTTIKYQTTDTNYHTVSTGQTHGTASMPAGAVGLEFVDFMGFWNGGAPQDQSWYVDSIVTANGQVGMISDNQGNLHIPYLQFP